MKRHFSEEGIQMADKHVKVCPTSGAIRKVQIKTITIPTEMARITPPNAGKGVEKPDHSRIAAASVKWHSYSGKRFSSFL